MLCMVSRASIGRTHNHLGEVQEDFGHLVTVQNIECRADVRSHLYLQASSNSNNSSTSTS